MNIQNTLVSNHLGIDGFIPTNAICVNAMTDNNELRKMVLLFKNTDSWLGMKGTYSIHEAVEARLCRMMHEDINVIGFKNQSYRIENGIYKLSHQTVVVWK